MLPDIKFTAAEAAPLLKLSDQTVIHKYVKRGKLSPAGVNGDGVQVFAWLDLVRARMTRRSGGGKNT